MEQGKIILTPDEIGALSDWLEIFILQEIRYYLYGAREEGLPETEFAAIFDDINYYWVLYNKVVSEKAPELDDNDIRVLANALAVGIPSAINEVQIENPYWILTMSTLWKKCSDIAFATPQNTSEVPNLLAEAQKEDEKKKNTVASKTEEKEEDSENSEKDEPVLKLQNLKPERQRIRPQDE